jgi:superfamily I DNA and RNA helicase
VLINTIIRTSRNEVRHGDEMPVWDDESCREEIRRLTETLQAHGIEQAWNFGRSRHLKPSRDGNVREL